MNLRNISEKKFCFSENLHSSDFVNNMKNQISCFENIKYITNTGLQEITQKREEVELAAKKARILHFRALKAALFENVIPGSWEYSVASVVIRDLHIGRNEDDYPLVFLGEKAKSIVCLAKEISMPGSETADFYIGKLKFHVICGLETFGQRLKQQCQIIEKVSEWQADHSAWEKLQKLKESEKKICLLNNKLKNILFHGNR
jgi:hypothetical protein